MHNILIQGDKVENIKQKGGFRACTFVFGKQILLCINHLHLARAYVIDIINNMQFFCLCSLFGIGEHGFHCEWDKHGPLLQK